MLDVPRAALRPCVGSLDSAAYVRTTDPGSRLNRITENNFDLPFVAIQHVRGKSGDGLADVMRFCLEHVDPTIGAASYKTRITMSDQVQGVESELLLERETVGALSFVAKGPDEAARFLCQLAKSKCEMKKGFHVHLANAYTVALADKDRDFRELLGGSAINFPDGKPIALVSKASRHYPRLRQVRGPDLFENVMDFGRADGVKHFLLGSTDDVLDMLEAALLSRYAGLKIVGKESPPFRAMSEEELSAQDKRIEACGAEIVWVGLGTPKQDFEVKRLADEMPVVAVAVGAAFDFSAGTLAVAPKWMQRTGLEWVHRLIKEPRRLWKRYLFGNARFIGSVLRATFRGPS